MLHFHTDPFDFEQLLILALWASINPDTSNKRLLVNKNFATLVEKSLTTGDLLFVAAMCCTPWLGVRFRRGQRPTSPTTLWGALACVQFFVDCDSSSVTIKKQLRNRELSLLGRLGVCTFYSMLVLMLLLWGLGSVMMTFAFVLTCCCMLAVGIDWVQATLACWKALCLRWVSCELGKRSARFG